MIKAVKITEKSYPVVEKHWPETAEAIKDDLLMDKDNRTFFFIVDEESETDWAEYFQSEETFNSNFQFKETESETELREVTKV